MDKDSHQINARRRALLRNVRRPHRPLVRGLTRGAQAAVDWVLPPRCSLCSDMINAEDGVCPSCFQDLFFLTDPLCLGCGQPHQALEGQTLAGQTPEGTDLCGPCLAYPPAFDWMRAAFAYNHASRALILALKYRDRLDVVPALGRWMALVAGEQIRPGDLILPVPLHWRRYLARRFNQSAALAQALAERTGGVYAPDWLRRNRNTAPMKAMSRKQRHANVQGAFDVVEPRRAALQGQPVVLVDDVYTSGATIEALSDVLRAQGVAHIGVVVVARVVRHTHLQVEYELE